MALEQPTEATGGADAKLAAFHGEEARSHLQLGELGAAVAGGRGGRATAKEGKPSCRADFGGLPVGGFLEVPAQSGQRSHRNRLV